MSDVEFESWPTLHIVAGRGEELPDAVAIEEPLELRLLPPVASRDEESVPLSVTMRTPGADAELVAGFLYGEGLIETRADLVELRDAAVCGVENRAEFRLRADLDLAARRSARSFLSTSACGVCGKTAIDHIFVRGIPLTERGVRASRAAFSKRCPHRWDAPSAASRRPAACTRRRSSTRAAHSSRCAKTSAATTRSTR